MGDVLVLCYHALSPTWMADLSITPDAFERQIVHLIDRGWQPVTFSQAALTVPAPRTLAITFDDAFASVKEYAVPILARLRAPATVFAPTAYMSGAKALAWPGIEHWLETSSASELTPMDWDDLEQLVEFGWEIGSHTRTHPHLTELDEEELTLELEASLQECTDRLGRPCQTVAYPYGDVDDRVVATAEQAGYLAGAGLSRSLKRLGPHREPRVGVYYGDTWARFRLKTASVMRAARTVGPR